MDPLQTGVRQMAGVVIDLDGSIFIQLAIVALVYVILRKLVFEPYLATLDAREAKTDRTREEAIKLKAEADALEQRYETSLADARDKAISARATLRAEGNKRREEVLGQARRVSNAKLDAARAAVDAQYEGVRTDLKNRVDEIAGLVVDKVLGDSPRAGS